MSRVGIVGLWQETNTYSSRLTTLEDFADFELLSADAVAERHRGTKSVIGGMLDADGFEVGNVSGPNDPDSMVVAQDPAPGELRPPGSEIDLTTEPQPVATCPAG